MDRSLFFVSRHTDKVAPPPVQDEHSASVSPPRGPGPHVECRRLETFNSSVTSRERDNCGRSSTSSTLNTIYDRPFQIYAPITFW